MPKRNRYSKEVHNFLRERNIKVTTIYARIQRGMTLEEAIAYERPRTNNKVVKYYINYNGSIVPLCEALKAENLTHSAVKYRVQKCNETFEQAFYSILEHRKQMWAKYKDNKNE